MEIINRENIKNLIYLSIDKIDGKKVDGKISDLLNDLLNEVNKLTKIKSNNKLIIKNYFDSFKEIKQLLKLDLNAFYIGDPAAYDINEIKLAYPGYFAIIVYRLAHVLYFNKVLYIPRMMSEYAHSKTGIDINPGAKIGKSFFIDHGTGVVIGETTIIGDNVRIYQGVTLGALSLGRGQALKGTKRHPTIGNNVIIYSGASILGGKTIIGNNVTIGSNAFIIESVKPNTIIKLSKIRLEEIKK